MYKQFPSLLVLATVTVLAWEMPAEAADVTSTQYLTKRGPKRPAAAGVKFAATAVVVGDQPAGYGSVAVWDRKHKDNIFVCFIAAKDDLGTAILNLKNGDRVEVLSATGIAEFSGRKGALIESIVGLAATAASAGAAALGAPEASPFIKAGGDFATKNFAKNGNSDARDAFGKDDGRETKRQEGGVLICMPEAGGVFYSGGDRKRWVQGRDGGERTDNRQPEHMRGRGAFFPIQGNQAHNTRTAKADGVLHLIAWDFDYPDNSGYYRVIIRVTRVD